MSEFFKTWVTWVVDFRFDGRPQRWSKAIGKHDDVRQAMAVGSTVRRPRAVRKARGSIEAHAGDRKKR